MIIPRANPFIALVQAIQRRKEAKRGARFKCQIEELSLVGGREGTRMKELRAKTSNSEEN